MENETKDASTEETSESNPQSTSEDKIAERLEGLKDQISNQGTMQGLLADPDVRTLLDLKRQGKSVKVASSDMEDARPEPPQVPDVPISDLSGDEFMNLISKAVSSHVHQVVPELVTASTKGMGEKLDQLMTWAGGQNTDKIRGEGEKLQAKYSDFMQWKTQMIALDEESGGKLGMEDLYILSKTRAGSPIEPVRELSSERPSGTPPTNRRVRSPEDNGKMKSGRSGFVSRLRSLEYEAPTSR